ncbi:MAG: GNAT family N-acetyltransferase [Candidatus Aegiribacteria sp.]|nr:GNAT family N-acetyltransferase [Candidatus Aegiribacteria sp.]
MKVRIEPLNVNHARVSWKWRNNPLIWKFTGSKPDTLITEDIETSWIRRVIQEDNSARYAIIVTDGETDTYVGNVQLTNITDKQAQYHIFIGDTDYWGKGVAYKATSQLLDFGFQHLKLNRIWLEVNKANRPAVQLYVKCGFTNHYQNDNIYLVMEKYSEV